MSRVGGTTNRSQPWVFPYVTEPGGETRSSPVLRPAVAVSLSHPGSDADEVSPKFLALVDSGSERTLAGPGLARLARMGTSATGMTIHIGGRPRSITFGTVLIRLYQDVTSTDEPPLIEWAAEVGFFNHWGPPWGVLLGQKGFFDRFTVSMSRFSQALAVEPRSTFDDRFGHLYVESVERDPRFEP